MAGEMMLNFSDSDHPMFRASSAFERGELRSEEGRKKSIHFDGSDENIELLLRTVISANQLSVYGAIADLCDEVHKRVRASVKLNARVHFEKVDIPTVLSEAEKFHQCTAAAKHTARIRAKIRAIVRRPETIQIVFWCGLEACLLKKETDATPMPRIHAASHWKENSYKRMDSKQYKNRSCLEHKGLLSWWSIHCWSSSQIELKHNDRTIKSVLTCQKPSPDC